MAHFTASLFVGLCRIFAECPEYTTNQRHSSSTGYNYSDIAGITGAFSLAKAVKRISVHDYHKFTLTLLGGQECRLD